MSDPPNRSRSSLSASFLRGACLVGDAVERSLRGPPCPRAGALGSDGVLAGLPPVFPSR